MGNIKTIQFGVTEHEYYELLKKKTTLRSWYDFFVKPKLQEILDIKVKEQHEKYMEKNHRNVKEKS